MGDSGLNGLEMALNETALILYIIDNQIDEADGKLGKLC
jgi:hypothetical protein